MMTTPKNIGLPTCLLAASTVWAAFLDRERASKLVLPLAKLAHDVFHNHDRAIDDQAEINRAETHQVAGDAEARHAGEREEKRKRDRRGDDERRAPVAEQHEAARRRRAPRPRTDWF